jgi:TctA family transporter
MPAEQKNIHIITEALAVVVLAPYLSYLAIYHVKSNVHKFLIFLIVLTTLIVDGYLFYKRDEWDD